MKVQVTLWAALVLLLVANIASLCQIQKYKYYYQATEKFLDRLEKEYNWADAIDDWDYYDAASKLQK